MTAPIELTGEGLVLRTTHPEDAAELRRIRLTIVPGAESVGAFGERRAAARAAHGAPPGRRPPDL